MTTTATRRYITTEDLKTDKVVYLSPGHAPSMVTTIGPADNINVASFEQTMVVSYRPPRILLAISPTCDTYKNITEGSDCVVGFPRIEYIQQAYDAGVKAPRNTSELEIIDGITTFPSKHVAPPSIEQCWINMECKLYESYAAGDHHLVVLDVVGISVDEDIWKSDKVARRSKLPAVYYTTSGHFHELGAEHVVRLSSNLAKYDNGD